MTEIRRKKIKKIFEDNGPIVKASILRENRLCSRDIAELTKAGFVKKHRTGFYSWVNSDNNMSDIELASSLIPNGVICLYTAAVHYELTTINPMMVSVAIPSSTVKPPLPEYPPIELYVFSSTFFSLGEASEQLSCSKIKIYDIERTVCDFFRLRYQLGEDVALEVLKSYMAQKSKNLQKLMEYAATLRIKTKIKPYVEAMI
jgi:predicted transcriptional regulator of viral defense system